MRIGAIHDVEDEVGVRYLFQRRTEGLDQVMRQMAHEAHRVRHGAVAPAGQVELAHRGVEGREQRVLHQHTRAREPVEQARLARVGVARERDGGRAGTRARTSLGTAYPLHLLELASQHRHLIADASAIGLDLGLARPTGADAARRTTCASACLPGERLTPAAQPRQEVLHLRQRDLGATRLAAGVLGEDVEDEPGAIDDLHLDHLLQVTQLAGAELSVADDGVGAAGDDEVPQLARLARADVRRGIRPVAPLDDAVEHQRPGRLRQGGQLPEAALRLVGRAFSPDTHEHDLLEADLAVLDLSDVLELGGQAHDTSQRLPILEVEFADRGLV